MPNDIFVSYSSSDREKAVSLVTMLRTSGYDVWIDQTGIHGADRWSSRIAEALEQCRTVVILLSKNSMSSENVAKEITAAAELKKSFLPVELETVQLKGEFLYHLSGLHRVAHTDQDAILRALEKLGITAIPHLSVQTTELSISPGDTRKSLMILPFEDLSPAGEDNIWFADGLMSELIDALTNIKSLRLIDQQTSRDFRNVKFKIMDLAREYSVRYFIQGSVRKFGDEIKISLELLDIETGDHLWQYSHRGAFAEIFDIQETIAEKVVEGLKLNLTPEEENILEERETDNPEAYALFLKGSQYSDRQTKENLEAAIPLYREAIRLDPGFVEPYVSAAFTLKELYRAYDNNADHLAEAQRLMETARIIRPSLHRVLGALSQVRLIQGHHEEAELLAKQFVKLEPNSPISHFSLGFCYLETRQYVEAIAPFEESIRIRPDYSTAHWNLCIAYGGAQDNAGRLRAATRALPVFEKRLRHFPDDENARVQHANLLFFANRGEEAARVLLQLRSINDSSSLYNLACLASDLGKPELAVEYLKNAFAAGFAQMELLRTDPDLEPLRGREDFQELMNSLNRDVRDEKNPPTP